VSDGKTDVSVLSLEDFQGRLQQRLDDVDAVLAKLDELGARRVPLGTFQDANDSADSYGWKLTGYLGRVERLREAIVAAQAVTATIIASYRTTEERNQADAADIAARLDAVTSALTTEDTVPRGGRTYV
jgi:hypothetical protein